jgi:hypothetical protein
MKASLAITALILAGVAALSWWQQTAVGGLREEQAALRAEAGALGLSVAEAADGPASHPQRANRQRVERVPQDVNAVAADVVQLLRDIKEGKLETSGKSGVERISEIFERLYQLDPAQVRGLLDEFRNSPELDNEARRNVIGFAILTLAESHPEAAVALFGEAQDLLVTEGNSDGRRDVLRKLLGSWAAKDPLAALDWVKKNESQDPDLRDPKATRALIAGAAQKDPALAFQLAAGLDGNEREAATAEIVKTARTPDAQREMLTLLRGMAGATGAERDEAMAKTYANAFGVLAKGVAEQGYDAAQRWLTSAKLDPDECGMLADKVASNKPGGDTGKWLEWMGANLPPDKVGGRIVPLMNWWTDEDYRAAGGWLAITPDGPVKNTAVVQYATRVAHYDPATAAKWVETLPPNHQRESLLREVYEEWNARDASAAAAFAAKHGIKP